MPVFLAACGPSLQEETDRDPTEVRLSLRMAAESASGNSLLAHTLGNAMLSYGPDSIGRDTMAVPVGDVGQAMAFAPIYATSDSLWFSARVLSNTDTAVYDRNDTVMPIPRGGSVALRLPMNRQVPVVFAFPSRSDFAASDSVPIHLFIRAERWESVSWRVENITSSRSGSVRSKCAALAPDSGTIFTSGMSVEARKGTFSGADDTCAISILTAVGRIRLEFTDGIGSNSPP